MVGARSSGYSMPACASGPSVSISRSSAERLRELVEKGDALASRLSDAADVETASKIRAELESVSREIAAARSGLTRPHELRALRSRSADSERDLDAFIDALEADGGWSEIIELTMREIGRLEDLLMLRRQKKQRIEPWLRQRMHEIVARHNRALDASKGSP